MEFTAAELTRAQHKTTEKLITNTLFSTAIMITLGQTPTEWSQNDNHQF